MPKMLVGRFAASQPRAVSIQQLAPENGTWHAASWISVTLSSGQDTLAEEEMQQGGTDTRQTPCVCGRSRCPRCAAR